MKIIILNNLFSMLFHEYGGGGILSGFLHPLLGLDHFLAMVAIGVISTQLGGKSVWQLPALFVVSMAIGSIAGIAGAELPLIEVGISASVLVLGVAIFVNRSSLLIVIGLMVVLFGALHGNAHGLELPTATNTIGLTVAYVFGFLIATIGLHIAGALIGLIAEKRQGGERLLRLSGAVVAVAGVVLLFQL